MTRASTRAAARNGRCIYSLSPSKGNPVHVRAVLYDYDTDNMLYGTVRVRR